MRKPQHNPKPRNCSCAIAHSAEPKVGPTWLAVMLYGKLAVLIADRNITYVGKIKAQEPKCTRAEHRRYCAGELFNPRPEPTCQQWQGGRQQPTLQPKG